MAWTWLSLWVTEQHHILACLKQWSYNKTQLPNDQIRSTWCISTRGNVSKACILTVFETIWNCRICLKTMSLKNAFWRYLTRFGTTEKTENNVSQTCTLTVFEKIRKCRMLFENNISKACILTVFEHIGKCRILFETNVFKACILMVFDTIWNCREKNRKQCLLNHSLQWRYFKRFGTA